MAKCVRMLASGEVRRLADPVALALVNTGKAEFCPKAEWKQGRKGLAEKGS